MGLLTRLRASCENSLSNLYIVRERLPQRFIGILLEGLRIFSVISGAVALLLLVCAADFNILSHVDISCAITVCGYSESPLQIILKSSKLSRVSFADMRYPGV